MASAQHMLWMLDEYETLARREVPRFHHRQAGRHGRLAGPLEATGYGVVFTVREALKELEISPEDTTASIQGFGNVGQYAVRLFTSRWAAG